MSFQAYLDNIETKTGVTPKEFLELAEKKGFTKSTKATEIIDWLSADYGLGRGHAMALVHLIKNGSTISDKHLNSGTAHSDSSTELKIDGIGK